MNKKNINIVFFILLIYVLIFQNFIEKYIVFFKYIDELLAIFTIPYLLWYIKKNNSKVKKDNFYLTVLMIILVLVGVGANYIYRYQSIKMIAFDIIICLKFFLVYLLFEIINKNEYIDHNSELILKNLKFITLLLFVFTICNYVFNIYEMTTERYGIKANMIFYSHPTYLAGVCVFLLISLFYFNRNVKFNDKYIIMNFIILISTLRMKAIGFAFISIYIIYYEKKKNKKISINKLGIIGIILFFMFYEQISFYFVKVANSARNVLLTTSFKILKDYFPIGTGFATFASAYSVINYSPVYDLYSIQNIRGISRIDSSFVSDCFWPMILGQFGFIGTMVYSLMLIIIYNKIQNIFEKKDINKYISKVLALVYLLIASTSESAFVNPIAIPLAIIMAL